MEIVREIEVGRLLEDLRKAKIRFERKRDFKIFAESLDKLIKVYEQYFSGKKTVDLQEVIALAHKTDARVEFLVRLYLTYYLIEKNIDLVVDVMRRGMRRKL